jgi:hypothetical protein
MLRGPLIISMNDGGAPGRGQDQLDDGVLERTVAGFQLSWWRMQAATGDSLEWHPTSGARGVQCTLCVGTARPCSCMSTSVCLAEICPQRLHNSVTGFAMLGLLICCVEAMPGK